MFGKPLMWAKLCDANVNCEGSSVCITFPISSSCFSLFLTLLSLIQTIQFTYYSKKRRTPAIRYYVLWYSLLLCLSSFRFLYFFISCLSCNICLFFFCSHTKWEWEWKVKREQKSEKCTNSNWDSELAQGGAWKWAKYVSLVYAFSLFKLKTMLNQFSNSFFAAASRYFRHSQLFYRCWYCQSFVFLLFSSSEFRCHRLFHLSLLLLFFCMSTKCQEFWEFAPSLSYCCD